MPDVFAAFNRDLERLHLLPHHQDTPDKAVPPIPTNPTIQETHMSKLDAARQAITAIADNPLIDAIAEAGIGKWMHPDEITAVVALWREVEYGRRQASQALTPQVTFSAAVPPPSVSQQPADSLTPSQTTAT